MRIQYTKKLNIIQVKIIIGMSQLPEICWNNILNHLTTTEISNVFESGFNVKTSRYTKYDMKKMIGDPITALRYIFNTQNVEILKVVSKTWIGQSNILYMFSRDVSNLFSIPAIHDVEFDMFLLDNIFDKIPRTKTKYTLLNYIVSGISNIDNIKTQTLKIKIINKISQDYRMYNTLQVRLIIQMILCIPTNTHVVETIVSIINDKYEYKIISSDCIIHLDDLNKSVIRDTLSLFTILQSVRNYPRLSIESLKLICNEEKINRKCLLPIISQFSDGKLDNIYNICKSHDEQFGEDNINSIKNNDILSIINTISLKYMSQDKKPPPIFIKDFMRIILQFPEFDIHNIEKYSYLMEIKCSGYNIFCVSAATNSLMYMYNRNPGYIGNMHMFRYIINYIINSPKIKIYKPAFDKLVFAKGPKEHIEEYIKIVSSVDASNGNYEELLTFNMSDIASLPKKRRDIIDSLDCSQIKFLI